MANREFIAAKDLPVTEAEEVNVLVVDPTTGELAQKVGANLRGGGSGGETPDMVITVAGNSNTKLADGNYTITEGSVDNVFAAFLAGRYPIVKVRFYLYNNDDYTAIREEYDAKVCTYGENIWFAFTTLYPYGNAQMYYHKVYMNGDGTLSSAVLKTVTMTEV